MIRWLLALSLVWLACQLQRTDPDLKSNPDSQDYQSQQFDKVWRGLAPTGIICRSTVDGKIYSAMYVRRSDPTCVSTIELYPENRYGQPTTERSTTTLIPLQLMCHEFYNNHHLTSQLTHAPTMTWEDAPHWCTEQFFKRYPSEEKHRAEYGR